MANAIMVPPTTLSSVTASSTASGYSTANVAKDPMGLVWRSAASGATQSLTIDLGADTALDTIILVGLAGAQSGWQWLVELATAAQGPFSGAHWDGVTEALLAGSVMPVNKRGKALWLAPAGAPATARYVRLTFSSLASAAVEVARVIVGQRTQLDRNFRFGAAFGVRPLGAVELSTRGVLLRRRGKKLRGVGISFPHVHRDEVEAKVMPLIERCGNDEPIAIVVDPAADPQRQNRMYFGFLTGDLGTTWVRANGFQADFNLMALD